MRSDFLGDLITCGHIYQHEKIINLKYMLRSTENLFFVILWLINVERLGLLRVIALFLSSLETCCDFPI